KPWSLLPHSHIYAALFLNSHKFNTLSRDKIHALEETLAKGSLKILKLSRARTNYAKLHNKLKLISTVHQTQPTIQLLLSTNEFVGALDLISTTQEVLAQELAGIHSFRHLGSQLAELEKVINKMLLAELNKYVTAKLNRPTVDPQPLSDDVKLAAIVLGMLREHNFDFVDVIREESFKALKATIKQSVIEAVATADDIDTEGNVGCLADQMRLLNYTQWIQMLRNVFFNIMVIVNRVLAFHGVICHVVMIAAGRPGKPPSLIHYCGADECEEENVLAATAEYEQVPELLHVSVSEDLDVMISEEEFHALFQNLQKMLSAVCDHAHDRCVKLMVARAKDGFLEKLTSSEFVTLSREVETFVSDCMKKCGHRSTSLRGSLQSQANRFVERFHEERKTKLSLILDSERWKQADVPVEFQEMVDNISKTGKMQLPEKRIDLSKKPGEFIIVNKEKYAVVGTVLMLLKMMVEYCECVKDIPAAAQDIVTRLIDLLKTFNSRTCQLVLGAGALQLVGLKTISTKNLALASRCLQLVVFYVPFVKNHFKTRLYDKKHMLKHLDQITKDYTDHIDEISNKLVAIMDVSTESYILKWDAKPPMPSQHFRNICKQMTKFYEVTIDVLPEHQVKSIFQRIHNNFVTLLRQQLLVLNVTNDGGPQNGLVNADINFYENSMKQLKGITDIINDLQTVWNTNHER
ncbi:vacuolar protein sorting-associated protein 54, partial [Octopus sinensis]|uniref:Vacuolar protein sorting-associated protein 54 n=1 Tax=Octopus sinensis TaxID=2607531 RepID=A0A6P7SXY5_9MOLL